MEHSGMITPNDNPIARIADLESDVLRLSNAISYLQEQYNGMVAAHGRHERMINDALIVQNEHAKLLNTLVNYINSLDEEVNTLFEITYKLERWAVEMSKCVNGAVKVKRRRWWWK